MPSSSPPFDIQGAYEKAGSSTELSSPLAAILALTELVEKYDARTISELIQVLKSAANKLTEINSGDIGVQAGCSLFTAFVSYPRELPWTFEELKSDLIKKGRDYAIDALSFRQQIAKATLDFIQDDYVILTHSYSRVVMQVLLAAHKLKRISVYVTEARPAGLGQKTCEELTAAGVPCIVVLDSAVAFIMGRVDIVFVGSEVIVESGGLINAIGSYQIAVIAKQWSKPFYAVAESYKFLRCFPTSQYDLPVYSGTGLLFPQMCRDAFSAKGGAGTVPKRYSKTLKEEGAEDSLSSEQRSRTPVVDYTSPDLITLVFSDVGILTPDSVSQYLVGMFTN